MNWFATQEFAATGCVVLLLLACIVVPLRIYITRILAHDHPLTHERLGRPTMANASAWWSKGYWGWLWFLYGQEYKSLGDSHLSRLCALLRVSNFLFWFVGFLVLTSIFVMKMNS